METRQLKYFLDVANCLNFTKAAQKNHIAQTAMSQNIISLENQLGFKLFERNNRNVRLTHLGEIFYQDAVSIIRSVERAEMRLKHMASGSVGTLRIGLQGEHESRFLPDLVLRFRAECPNVAVELVQGISARLEEFLEADEVDLIFNLKYQPTFDGVDELLVDRQNFCLIVPANHRFAKSADPISYQEIGEESIVFLDPSCSESIYNYMIHESMSHGFMPNVVGYANSIYALMLMVRCGLGITIQPSSFDTGQPGLVFIPLPDKEPIQVVARWKKENQNPALIRFLELLRSTYPDSKS